MTALDITLVEVLSSEVQWAEIQRLHSRFMQGRRLNCFDVQAIAGGFQLDEKYRYEATCPGCRLYKVRFLSPYKPEQVSFVPICSVCKEHNRKAQKRGKFFGIW